MKKLLSITLILVLALTGVVPVMAAEESVIVTQNESVKMDKSQLTSIMGGALMCRSWWLAPTIAVAGSFMAGPAFGIMWSFSVSYICSRM